MTRVFISYSRRDLAFVEQLAADLKAAGLDVWYDLSGLEGGQRWRIEIEKAIRASQYVIIVLSPDSVVSEWVEREYLYASNLGKNIVPLFYEQCDLPMYYLNVHFINVQGENYKRNFGEILRTLGMKPVVQKKPPQPGKPGGSAPAKLERKDEVAKPKRVRTEQKWDSKSISLLVALVGLILVSVFGLPPLLSRPENVPEQTVTLTKEINREPSITATIEVTKESSATPKPSATSTKVITATPIPLPTEITDNFGVKMALVPAGTFVMGSDHNYADSKPAHEVYLDSYYVDIYEVTNAAYTKCIDGGVCIPPVNSRLYLNPGYFQHPVNNVDWNMAKTYCEWRGARLPTEAEWEKAARGTDERIYPWGDDINCSLANYFGGYKNPGLQIVEGCPVNITKVGSYEDGKSPYGIYDMAGNVWEWVNDWYDDTYYQNSPFSNPLGPSSGQDRVLRGGSYFSNLDLARSTFRYKAVPTYQYMDRGFRCAKEATP